MLLREMKGERKTMADDRTEEGKFSEQYATAEFLEAIEALPVASTQKIADEVGCSYNLAYRRLRSLEERGSVKHEEVGTSFVWLASDE